jgi:two-component system, NarL family, response regulator NreC
MAAYLRLAPAPRETTSQPPAISPIRVVLADDHALMRHSLRLLLEGEDGVEVTAEADDIASAVHQVQSHKPDVLVLDLRMRGGSSIETIGELRRRAPETEVVVVTMSDGPAFARHVLASGALGFVLKELAEGELPQAVRAAASGEEFISPHVAHRLQVAR